MLCVSFVKYEESTLNTVILLAYRNVERLLNALYLAFYNCRYLYVLLQLSVQLIPMHMYAS